MELRDIRNILKGKKHAVNPLTAVPVEQPTPFAKKSPALEPYVKLKKTLGLRIRDRVDQTSMEAMSEPLLRQEISSVCDHLFDDNPALIDEFERRMLMRDIQNEMAGLGPLDPLLVDPSISGIMVNRYNRIYVERHGRIELTDATFVDDKHLLRIIDRIVSRAGSRIDESSPMVDARLPDGSRINAVIPPVAIDGATLSIRRYTAALPKMNDLVNCYKSMTPEMALLMEGCVKSKINMIISGAAGSGKTTLLNILSACIPGSERIVTIENEPELQLQQESVIRLEMRPPDIEGKGEINQSALVRNALRMRPDRIVMGEIRGAEALEMMQAMATGPEGSLTTVRADNPYDAISRLENMVSMAGARLLRKVARAQIASALSVVVQLNRLPDGQHKVTSMQEITGIDGEVLTMQEFFNFRQTGRDSNGKITGYFQATGIHPKFFEQLRNYGVNLQTSIFDPSKRYK